MNSLRPLAASLLFFGACVNTAEVSSGAADQTASEGARLNGGPGSNPAVAYHFIHSGNNLGGFGFPQVKTETSNGLTDDYSYTLRAEAGVDVTVETSSDGWYRYGDPVFDPNCGCCEECNPWVQPQLLSHSFTHWYVGYKIDGVLQTELDATDAPNHQVTLHVPSNATDKLEYWFRFTDADGTTYWDSKNGSNYVAPIVPKGGALVTFDSSGAPRVAGPLVPGGALRIDYDFHRFLAQDSSIAAADLYNTQLSVLFGGSSRNDQEVILIPVKQGSSADVPARAGPPAVAARVAMTAAFRIPLDAQTVEIDPSTVILLQPPNADQLTDGPDGMVRSVSNSVQPHHVGYVFNVTGGCPSGQVCNAVDATFSVNATTVWGQGVFVVGSIPELGSWNAKKAIKLDAGGYPTWAADITLPKNKSFEFKFIKVDAQNNVVWESRNNRPGQTNGDSTAWFGGYWNF